MRASSQKLGDPQDPQVSLGPLADSSSLAKVKAMVARGRQEATLVAGGEQQGENGCFMQPTVFLNPKPDAEILREEVFGPVSVVMTFKTEEEVLKLANDTEFGLMAGVFTKDISRALRVSSSVESGVVGINCISAVGVPSLPSQSHSFCLDEHAGAFWRQKGFWNRERIWRICEWPLNRNIDAANNISRH